ncbi:hypothetical protein KAFR_0A04040 [Kazachstania africana CBS 2517]|uniref:Uncharacterized protein n=1 Tax=Kazachstania africana (strain ATCC 22294 / BCRC 22015 / CBS 2517 / CECT 1963 / NBRC 1671 / NRRL Y-8276) TaxID=1071382 RepID=H2AN89_KAZAF|nr:hypothetical protein KAFR_0A04040 [Kazachstania africana CBS 2517]CCF55839.1 hypothetical protein KAFR_0A04040 [Kazachstania africana CBS 2517]
MRKFSGQRIQRDVDVVRPPSLDITAEDLLQIPDVPILSPDSRRICSEGNKLSSKYGGTIRLKKRLDSVPELFHHEYFRKVNDMNRPDTLRDKRQMQTRKNIPQYYERLLPPSPMFKSNELRPLPKIPKSETYTQLCKRNNNQSDLLYEEIIAAYLSPDMETSTTKQQNLIELNKRLLEPVPEINTPPRYKRASVYSASPEYIGGNSSDDNDLFSEYYSLKSPIQRQYTSDEDTDSYRTARDSFASFNVKDLDITSSPSSDTYDMKEQTNNDNIMNQLTLNKLTLTTITPKIFNYDYETDVEEDDVISQLKSKIDHVSLLSRSNTVITESSSVYSEM